MSRDLVTLLHARLDEEADLARRCEGDGCGEWTADGHTVDFCQGELSGFHSTIALHAALHDPTRVLREVEARRRVPARHVLSPATGDPELPWDSRDDCQDDGDSWPCDDLLDLTSPYACHPDCTMTTPDAPEAEIVYGTTLRADECPAQGLEDGV
ncbi:DUF6221 family protein [Streptomyces sp. NRRL F-2664]|uniref:DUF6221 family protein n=1 Tax=Streptomyces sp. NRRL F-2664 TaxID=1463842 RepID=UPI001F41DD65|nr:DUF6221 family protein [Streptomyces sp. NRRL F-2664]